MTISLGKKNILWLLAFIMFLSLGCQKEQCATCIVSTKFSANSNYTEASRYAKCGKRREVEEFKEKEETTGTYTGGTGSSTKTECIISDKIEWGL